MQALPLAARSNRSITNRSCTKATPFHVKQASSKLYLGGNYMGWSGVQKLARVLLSDKGLKEVYLEFNNIGDKGAQLLAEALIVGTGVEKLYLGHNNIGDKGAKALAKALRTSTSLKVVCLRENAIGDEGAQDLAEVLRTNKRLDSLNLNRNHSISEESKATLLNAKQFRATNVAALLLAHPNTDQIDLFELASLTRYNTTLETLVL